MTLRLLLLLAAVLLLPLVIRALFPSARRTEVDMSPRRGRNGEELVRDPACLTYVPRSTAVAATVAGEPLFFCSEACAESYRRIKEG